MPNHIKIDVDGIESKVIAGAKETLQSQELRSLMIEINDDLPDDLEMIFYLESLGFKATPAPPSHLFNRCTTWYCCGISELQYRHSGLDPESSNS
jgi:hypothetical protein